MKARIAQLRQTWQLTAKHDPRMPVFVLVPAAVTLVALVVLGIVTRSWVWYPLAVLTALSVAMIMFGRRAQAAQYSAIEGQTGAGAAVLNVMRGQWFVNPAVAFNKKQDMVHRVVGRCGIVLVGEGSPNGVKQLMAKEKQRLKRISGDTSIHTVFVGNGQGQTSIAKLQLTMNKLPRELKKTEVPKLERRLKPLDRDLPMPKGYIPNPGKKMR